MPKGRDVIRSSHSSEKERNKTEKDRKVHKIKSEEKNRQENLLPSLIEISFSHEKERFKEMRKNLWRKRTQNSSINLLEVNRAHEKTF